MSSVNMAVSRKICRLAAIFALTVVYNGCAESPSAPLHPNEPEAGLIGGTLRLVGQLLPILDTVAEETIGPEGGTLEIAGGHSLYFPAGALDDTITISAVRDPLKILVDFGPSGLVFPDSARPTLTYDYSGMGLLGLLNPSGLTIVYLEGASVAEVLPTVVDREAKVARAEISHFSTYALATD
jgi:hypothetical protein